MPCVCRTKNGVISMLTDVFHGEVGAGEVYYITRKKATTA